MNENKRTFSGKAMRVAEQELEGAMPTPRDEAMAAAVREAMNRINYASDTIRSCVGYLRRDLDEVMEQLDGGYSVRQIGHQSPADLREAIKMRADYFDVLVSLIGPEDLKRFMEMR